MYLFNMDGISNNNKLINTDMDVPVHGNPRVVQGRLHQGIKLDGNSQYIDIGRHSDSCLGNPQYCRHGSTSSMWVNFQRFEDDMYYYSSGDGVTMYFKNGKLYIALETADKRWEMQIPELKTNRWYFVEYTWHPEKGLRVYLNNNLVGEAKQPQTIARRPSTGVNHVYVGRANPGDTASGYYRFANMIVDNTESWYGHRDYLTAWGYLLRGINPSLFPLPLLPLLLAFCLNVHHCSGQPVHLSALLELICCSTPLSCLHYSSCVIEKVLVTVDGVGIAELLWNILHCHDLVLNSSCRRQQHSVLLFFQFTLSDGRNRSIP